VANLTTPANLFHLMRRQMAWSFRKPCIVMSPKSMLRNPACVSPLSELVSGRFCEVYGDTYANPKKVKRVLMCSGKVYYDLLDAQQKGKRDDVALVRIEQLHPLPAAQIEAEIAKYPKAKLYWVQEEPQNMGYWTYMLREFGQSRMELIARKVSASPSTGFLKIHNTEQADLIAKAFA
jgi:2-oxoglutarate dehydrogenase E1 component